MKNRLKTILGIFKPTKSQLKHVTYERIGSRLDVRNLNGELLITVCEHYVIPFIEPTPEEAKEVADIQLKFKYL